jgi:hypothetical protein
MAGSYAHVTDKNGRFRSDFADFTGMIENLGDAYEACEEMHWMIRFLAGDDEATIDAAHAAGVKTKFKEVTPGAS